MYREALGPDGEAPLAGNASPEAAEAGDCLHWSEPAAAAGAAAGLEFREQRADRRLLRVAVLHLRVRSTSAEVWAADAGAAGGAAARASLEALPYYTRTSI